MKKYFFMLMVAAVCCSCQNKLRLVSYNIHDGRSADGKVQTLKGISQVLNDNHVDAAFIQEVDSVTHRNKIDEARVLGDYCAMYPTFAAAIPYGKGEYGIAILSKKRPLSIVKVPLPGSEEKRVFLLAEYKHYYIGCTHFSLTEADQLKSVDIISATVAQLKKPVFIGGDFNAIPTSEVCNRLSKIFLCLSDTTQHTFPSDAPNMTIDYIWAKNFKGTIIHRHTITESKSSDHRPIFINVKW